MATRYRKPQKSNTLLWIILSSVGVIGLSVGIYFILKGKTSTDGKSSPTGEAPGFVRAEIDPNNVENTRAWAADTVKRLKENPKEITRVEKELKDSLLGKKIRWAFPVETVVDGEIKLDTFFGTKAGEFRGDDPKLKGKPLRKLYFRAFFDSEKDAVMVGDEVTKEEASRLKKGSNLTLLRTVTEVTLTKKDDRWVSASSYNNFVDVLEPYCITIVLERK